MYLIKYGKKDIEIKIEAFKKLINKLRVFNFIDYI